MPRSNPVLMTLLFLTSNFLGLAAAARQITLIEAAAVETSAVSGLALFTMLVFVSVFLLVLYKYELFSVVAGWFTLAIFFSILLFVSSFVGFLPAALTAVLATALYKYGGNVAVQNLVLAVAFAGAGSYIGVFLGFTPVLVLIVLLAVYDTVAVFYTEHMVNLAEKGLTSDTFMGFSLAQPDQQRKQETVEEGEWTADVNVLGGGDVVIPLLFAVAVLRTFGFIPAFLSVLGAAAALHGLFHVMQRGKAYPAIPVVAVGSFAGYFTWLIPALFS